MLRRERSAPIWLFSFVDLAFLLLIAFTQIGPQVDRTSPPIGQIEIPRLETAAAPLAGSAEAVLWQLRVHPPSAEESDAPRQPFELIRSDEVLAATPPTQGSSAASEAGERIDAQELVARLEVLHERRTARPILAPHRDSRSEDLLVAVGLLESAWQADRSVAVLPGPPVAAGPDETDERTPR